MRHLPTLALTLLAAGCASGSPSTRTVDEPVSYDVPATQQVVHLTRDADISTGWIDAAPDEVWTRLPAVYAELGLDADALSVRDPAARRIAVQNHRVRRLGGERLSRLLDCGPSRGTPKADNGQARVDLETWLEPADGGTRVRIRFGGRSRDLGSSGGAVVCSSKGTLERELTQRLSRLVAGG